MKRLVLALAFAMMAASVVWGIHLFGSGEAERPLMPPPAVDAARLAALQNLALPDLDGRVQPLSQWRGRVLVINYWATWCRPCRDEMPMFSKLQQRLGAKGVQFVGIDDEPADTVREFVRAAPPAYPLLVGTADTLAATGPLGNVAMALPFTVVLGRDGSLQAAVLGRVSEGMLTRLIEGLL